MELTSIHGLQDVRRFPRVVVGFKSNRKKNAWFGDVQGLHHNVDDVNNW